MLESMSHHSVAHDGEAVVESYDELHMDHDESILLVGGYDGVSWLSTLDAYSPFKDEIKSLKPMDSVRSYASVAKLNGELYVFGGGNGSMWYDTGLLKRFDPREHSWTRIESVNTKRGCTSLIVLNEKFYAIVGYDGNTMITSIGIFDPRLGTWMTGEPMNQARYSAAAVVKEHIYVIGEVKSGHDIVNVVECYKDGKGWEETKLRAVGSSNRQFC